MFLDERLQTPVEKNFDVAVCGGGFGGISAALAAARSGRKTVVFEKEYILGGLGTAGLVTIYLPLCDGCGHQVSFGIAEELFRLSISHGAEARLPENWLCGVGALDENSPRFEVQYNPQLFAVLAEKLLLDSGVTILYGSYAVGVQVENQKITHLITESKSGRRAYAVSSVVDATGDCDIAAFAGAPTETFKQGNVLAAWYYSLGKDGYKLNLNGACDIPDTEKPKGHSAPMLSALRFSGLNTEELSRQVCLSHNSLYGDFLKKRAADSSYVPVTMPTIPQVRMTRKIAGVYELSHTEEHKFFEDSIGMVSNWKKRGPVYEVPFRTLFSAKVKNLICAGRCTSVDETLWDVMRVIPCCAVTGQAAGTAAALTDDFTNLDISLLQNELVKNGVVLHESDL
ncbi:MAG: FAD-dependent oxidoreductase [Clostridia bacterium]|nr:FAD-dependent oxidoreductase [Clostridia bacterium]